MAHESVPLFILRIKKDLDDIKVFFLFFILPIRLLPLALLLRFPVPGAYH